MITNIGKYNLLNRMYRGAARPTNYFVALCTNVVPPTVDTLIMSQVSEIAQGNGYTTGGIMLSPNDIDFDTLIRDDDNDRAILRIKDITWTAVDGPLPATGAGARWAVLRSNLNSGLPVMDISLAEIEAFWDLGADRSVVVGQSLKIEDAELRLFNL